MVVLSVVGSDMHSHYTPKPSTCDQVNVLSASSLALPQTTTCLLLHPFFRAVRIAALGGNFSGPTTPYDKVCPEPAWVTSIRGRQSNWIDAIGPFGCSDGSTISLAGDASAGGLWNNTSPTGYLNFTLRAGPLTEALTLVKADGISTTYGSFTSTHGLQTLACPPGTRLAGMYGDASQGATVGVVSVGLICRPVIGR